MRENDLYEFLSVVSVFPERTLALAYAMILISFLQCFLVWLRQREEKKKLAKKGNGLSGEVLFIIDSYLGKTEIMVAMSHLKQILKMLWGNAIKDNCGGDCVELSRRTSVRCEERNPLTSQPLPLSELPAASQ